MNCSSGFTLFLVLILLMVLSAGCMSSDIGPPYPHYGKSLEQICKGDSVNGSKWIVVDPISDIKVGEKITVTAKTNLSTGSRVSVQTWPYTYNPVNTTDASGSSGISDGTDTTVKEGNAGVNTITFATDSKNFRPEPYIITFFNDTEHVSVCTWYNVSIEPEENPTISPLQSLNNSGIIMNRNSSGFWLSVDPIESPRLGTILTILGTTNLPAGDNITISIYEDYRATCSKCIKEVDSVGGGCCRVLGRNVTINPGMDGVNKWSLVLNTSEHNFQADYYGIFTYSDNFQRGNISHFKILEPTSPNSSLPDIT